MVIRKAEEHDLAEILALYAQLEANRDCGVSMADAKDIFSRMKSYPDYSVYVAVSNGTVVGTFSLAIMDNIAHGGARSGLIEDVVVSETCRRRGIGKHMMRAAMDLCKQKACYKVALSSNIKRKDAHLFYKSLGFKIHGYSFLMEC